MFIYSRGSVIRSLLGACVLIIILAFWLGRNRTEQYLASEKQISEKLERSHQLRKSEGDKPIAGNHAKHRGKSSRGEEVSWSAETTQDSKELLEKLKGLLDSGDELRAVDAIQGAEKLASQELVAFTKYVLDTQRDPNLRWDALGLLKHSATREVLPLLGQAIQDSNEVVRTTAIDTLANFNDARKEALEAIRQAENPTAEQQALLERETLTSEDMRQISSFLLQAMNDNSEDVLNTAMGVLEQLDGDLQLLALDAALHSSNQKVTLEALDTISVNTNKDTIWLVMDSLGNGNGAIFERAQKILENSLDQTFERPEEALHWWNENQARYDYDLVEVSSIDNTASDEDEGGCG